MNSAGEGRLVERDEELTLDHSASAEHCRRILEDYPNFERIDEVLYYLGRGTLEVGTANKDSELQQVGIGYLNDLVHQYPLSNMVPLVLLHLGDHYFENNSLHNARSRYEAVIRNHSTPPTYYFFYALYRLAWVNYVRGEFHQSVKMFHRTIDATWDGDTGLAGTPIGIRALEDLVLPYAEMEHGWKAAMEFCLKRISRENAAILLHQIGDYLVARAKWDEALELFEALLDIVPLSSQATEYYNSIYDIVQRSPDWSDTERVVTEMMDYFKKGSRWMIAHKDNTEAIDAALSLVEEAIYLVANYYHVEGDKLEKTNRVEQAVAMHTKAVEYYKQYITRYPNSPRSYKVNFWYAEILYFNLNDYKNAAKQYKQVIQKDAKGKFVEDSALGVIYCMEALMVQEGLRKRTARGKQIQVKKISADKMQEDANAIERTDLHPLEEDFIKAADKYTELLLKAREDPDFRKKYPTKGEMIPNIMYIAAETFYKLGMYEEALLRFQNIFKYDPKPFGAGAKLTACAGS